MNKEVQSIAAGLRDTLDGQPWFGKAVYEMLEEIDPSVVYDRPNDSSHSLMDLIYHMITWAGFTLRRLQEVKEKNMAEFEKLDWREIDPKSHTWERGLQEFKKINEDILALLQTKDDAFLEQIVDYRPYNFRHLLNGYVQHNIYHMGQVAYVHKLLGRAFSS